VGGGTAVGAATAATAATAAGGGDGLAVVRLLVRAGAPLGAVNGAGLSPRALASAVGAWAAERELAATHARCGG